MQVSRIYKDLLRESGKFNSYYYKNYFTRKTKAQFRKHINADPENAEKLMRKAEEMLAMLKRQTMIINAYDSQSKLVIENNHEETESSQHQSAA